MTAGSRPTGRVVPAAALGLGACALSVPPLRSVIEQSMLWHMVVQVPLLVAAGWLLAGALRPRPRRGATNPWDHYGLTSFMLAQVIASHWMLPSAIDRAVVLPAADLLKLLTLLAGGALLHRAFRRSPAALQLFFVGYAVSMLFAAGAYLATTDRRLCNAYALEGQWHAGLGLIGLGAAVGTAWAWRAFSKAPAVGVEE
jgi:hypothetical protein